jgi:hypothetical protein
MLETTAAIVATAIIVVGIVAVGVFALFGLVGQTRTTVCNRRCPLC